MKYCSAPWNTIHITRSGLFPDSQAGVVSSCFCDAWQSKGENTRLGNKSLSEVFNNDWQKEFRSTIIDQSFKHCREDVCVDFHRMEEVDNFDHVPIGPTLPTTIQLQIDHNCNLKCKICRKDIIYSPKKNKEASAILRKLSQEYKEFEHRVNVHCDGSGDIFTSASYLEFFYDDNLPKCFMFNLQTNGNQLTKHMDLVIKLKDQLEMVEVSLDAGSADVYQEVRGGKLSIVTDGIRLLKQQGIEVWTQFVVQQKNYHDIEQYIKLCKDLGVDKICLQLMLKLPHMTYEWWQDNSVEMSTQDTEYLDSLLQEIKKDPQIEVSGGIEHLLKTKKVFQLHPN